MLPTSKSLLFLVVLLLSTASVAAAGLINGGFETGDLTGWTVVNQAGGSGSFYIVSGITAPLSGSGTVGPAGGVFYAVSDQTGPGTHALIQPFALAPGLQVILTFDMFANDWDAGPTVNPAGLDYTAIPNQHGRVDLLTGTAGPFDTGSGVIRNFYLTVDPGADPNAYTHYVFDITDDVAAGGLFQIRFAEVDNQLFFNMGVDNVSIDAVPEPAGVLLCGLGLACLMAYRRRCR